MRTAPSPGGDRGWSVAVRLLRNRRKPAAGFVFLQDIEQRSLDLRFALRGKRAADPRIVIVGIDEKTLQEIGSYPLPRSTYALLVRKLKEDGARVSRLRRDLSHRREQRGAGVLERLRKEVGPKATPAQLQSRNECTPTTS